MTIAVSVPVPGPRNPNLTPYVVPFERAVDEGAHRRYVLVMGAQGGKTDSALDLIGHRLDQRPAPILYVGPSRDFNTDQFEPRLMTLLDEAPTLMRKVVRGRRMACIMMTGREDPNAMLSVSQNAYEMPRSAANRSQIASIKRPPAVMCVAMKGAKNSPGSSK